MIDWKIPAIEGILAAEFHSHQGAESMPMYEYSCGTCGARFEKLVRSDENVTCESCGGEHVRKLLSLFALGKPSAAASAPSCACGGFEKGQCGSGMCGAH